MSAIILPLFVGSPAPAAGSAIRYVDLELMVHTSSRIVVGEVTGSSVRSGDCSISYSVSFVSRRVLKGHPGIGVYTRTYWTSSPGCPSGSSILAPCPVDFRDDQRGQLVIFLAGSRHGDGCAHIADEREIARVLATPPSIDSLIDKLSSCIDSDCYYLEAFGTHSEAALPKLREAIFTQPVDLGRQQLHLWALARIKSARTCQLLHSLATESPGIVPDSYIFEAAGNAGCRSLLPLARRRFADGGPTSGSMFATLRMLEQLGDRQAVPILTATLFDPAWEYPRLNIVLALGQIGDERAIEPLCKRLSARGAIEPVVTAEIANVVATLGGSCGARGP